MRELTEKFLFTLSLCDRNGYWLPSQILMMMQEMGGRHGQTLGVGRAEMLAKNAVWVLTRNEYRLLRLPRPGELIVAKTHPGPARRTLYPRYHTFELEDGTPLAEGIGGWTLCDVSTRRMAHLPKVAGLIPDTADLYKPFGSFPSAVEALEGETEHSLRELHYCDFDVNGHVNNTRAGDWVCDMLGPERLKGRPVRHLVVNYSREILPGGPVELSLTASGDRFFLRCEREGELLLSCGGELGPQANP